MTTADYEKLGRELLKSYLDTLPGLEISMETTDKYDPVDYFAEFTDFRRCEFEIKTRASKYKDYLTHVLEKEKYNNMIKSKEEHSISFSYYVNFFIGQEIYMYLYNSQYHHYIFAYMLYLLKMTCPNCLSDNMSITCFCKYNIRL